jgi:hypothetical protein
VVEQSTGLNIIRSSVPTCNVEFLTFDIEIMFHALPSGTAELLILHRVTPHIAAPDLRATFARLSNVVTPHGHIYLVSSYLGVLKKESRFIMAMAEWCNLATHTFKATPIDI